MERSRARRIHPRRTLPALAVVLAVASLAACSAGSGRVALPEPGAGACGPERSGDVAPAGTLTVVADGPARPVRLPHTRSLAERLLVRHLHRSLVRVDCRGRIRPELAAGWSREADGRRWRFRLREASAPDGNPITAGTVVAAWQESRLAAPPPGPGLLDSLDARAAGPRALVVEAPRPLPSPAVFARPAFAVVERPAAGGWPGATGPYRTDRAFRFPASAGRARVLALRPLAGGSGPRLRVAPSGPGRARDLVDAGADLLLTRHPAVLAYAEAAGEMDVRPLPWDRTYLLLVPPGGAPPSVAGEAREDPEAQEALRRSLARWAVRGAARPAGAAGWWTRGSCGNGGDVLRGPAGGEGPADGEGPDPGRSVLVHPRADRPAADLAGRLAALAGRGGGTALPWPPAAAPRRTEPLGRTAFRRSLAAGRAAGYVLPVRRRVLDPCGARAALRARAPWLARPGARVVPLVATRPGLAVRRGVGGLRIDWDGVPRLGDATRREEP